MTDSHLRSAATPASPASPTSPISEPMLPASALRNILLSLREVSGAQYPRLLRAAGLDTWLDDIPADDGRPLLGQSALVRLNQAVYQMLGEDLTRLYYRNLGVRQAALIERTPWADAIRAKIAPMPADAQFDWVVYHLLGVARRGWNWHDTREDLPPWYEISEDGQAWYLTALHCTSCAGVQGAATPLCMWVPSLFGGLARNYGQRVHVRETECAAMGAPRCKYAVDKRR